MLLPLEAYFSHHKEEDSSVFHCFLKKKKLSAVQSIYDPSFLSFSRYLFSSSLFLLIESREKIHRTQSWTFYRNVQKTFSLVFHQFEAINFSPRKFCLRCHCCVTWKYFGRLKRPAKRTSSVGKTFLSPQRKIRDFHFNFQHLLPKKALVSSWGNQLVSSNGDQMHSLEKRGLIK